METKRNKQNSSQRQVLMTRKGACLCIPYMGQNNYKVLCNEITQSSNFTNTTKERIRAHKL